MEHRPPTLLFTVDLVARTPLSLFSHGFQCGVMTKYEEGLR